MQEEIKMTPSEQSVYNLLTALADDDGEISEEISLDSLGRIAGVGNRDSAGAAQKLLQSLQKKGHIKMCSNRGSILKDITLLNYN